MTDIVRRLNGWHRFAEQGYACPPAIACAIREAAEEIERLEAEVKCLSGTLHGAHVLSMDAALKDNRRQAKEIDRLRAALRDVKEISNKRMEMSGYPGNLLQDPILNIARAALEVKDG